MKFLLLTLFVICSAYPAISQSSSYLVSGKVTDIASGAPLAGASVFAQNTTIGVATNSAGEFSLKLPNGGYDLVVTFTGYETESIRVTTASGDGPGLAVPLKAREKAMEEVSVVVSNEVKDGWQKYGAFFTDNFIGKTKFSNQCTIQNPEVLKFFFSKKRNRLKVTSAEPLVVINKGLGYKISFAIDSFSYEYSSSVSQFTGYPLFEEMQGSAEELAAWKKNRILAYEGSTLHFMRSLFDQTLADDGFEVQFLVKNSNGETPLPLKNPYGALNYTKDDSTNTVTCKPNQPELAVIYTKANPEAAYLLINSRANKSYQVSTLSITPGESFVIEENGYYYDQKDITTNDYWGFKKTGDMLPYDYDPDL